MVLLTPSVMFFKDVKCVAHSERGHTISNVCGFTEREIKFQRFFSVFVFRCKTHCNVYGGIRLRDCAFSRCAMCSRLRGVPCFSLFRRLLLMASGILFGFPSALQQVYVSCEDCARGARSELYVFSRRRSNSFQRFLPSSFHHVRLLPRCLLPHRCLV